jgi:hypothetical protein
MRKSRLTRKVWMIPLAFLVAVGMVVALGLYVRSFRSTRYPPITLPTAFPGGGAPYGSSTPARHPGTNAHRGSKPSRPGVHRLVAHVRSSERIGVIGYLVPTSPNHSYGKVKNVGKSWTVRTRVTGRPKYAIIWITGAKDGTPVSCSIAIDGKVVDRQRTKGPYGRQACSG